MKRRLRTLRFRILLPVVCLALFIVTLLNTMYSNSYIQMILRQEQDVNAESFAAVSDSVVPLISSSVSEVRNIVSDERVASYIRLQYASEAERISARIRCRDYLRAELESHDRVFGLLYMPEDGSLFGVLPMTSLFLDSPEDNPLPADIKEKIMNVPPGQTIWVGPVSGAALCDVEGSSLPKSIMIAAWKSVHVSYGECYVMMLMDESILENLFSSLQGPESNWYLFTEDLTEIWHTGHDIHPDPKKLIGRSNTGRIFRDGNGLSVCTFSMKMDSAGWTLVRKVSMESYMQAARAVRNKSAILGAGVLLIVLLFYELWLKKFLLQFRSLQDGVARMGQGDLESSAFIPSPIEEFRQMQQEIDRTRLALNHQMDTIRLMEREQAEAENRKKEQERIAEEMILAREIQANSLPSVFPPFPERTEFSLYASMTPARGVGGDFYDFFLIGDDQLALVIADVSGKGIPAALFMMVTKTLIKNYLLTGCDPATALEKVNLQLNEGNTSRMFVTVWLAVLDIGTGKGLACNAGHEHPALRRAGGSFELLRYKHGIMVGISQKARYQNREFELHPGDCIFVYTDGVPEATAGNREMFGTGRLTMALNSCPDCRPEEILRAMKHAVDTFVGDAEQFDDLTMMCLEYNGPEKAKTADGQAAL